MKNQHLISLGAAFALLINLMPMAHAQPAQEGKLDTVVVLGTATEKTLLEAPQSTEVITAEDINFNMAQNIGDVLDTVPGVYVAGGPRSIGQTPNIRGLSGARVQLRLDETRMNFLSGHLGRLFVDVDDIQKIEILKGNASSLYGSDAIGGVINITTKDPSDLLEEGEEMGIRLKSNFASANREFRQSLSTYGQADNGLGYLFSLSHWDTTDTIELSDGTELSDSEQFGENFLAKLLYEPDDVNRFGFTYNRYSDDAVVPGNPAQETSGSNFLRDRDTIRELFKLDFGHAQGVGLLADVDLDVYYQTYHVRDDRLQSTTQFTDTQLSTFGIDLKNTNDFDLGDTTHQLTYGLEFYRDIANGNRFTTSGGNIGSYPDGDFEGRALFIQDDIALFDGQLSIIPAVRWDEFISNSAGQPENSDSRISPKIGLVYKPVEDMALFTNYGRGFRAPRLTELYPSGTHFGFNNFVPNPTLEAEKSENFEIGARGEWGRLSYESVYFHTRADDFIFVDVGGFFGTTTASNVDRVRIHGYEGSLEYDIGFGFSTYLTATVLRGKNRDTGDELTSIPGHQLNWGLTHVTDDERLKTTLAARFVDDQERPNDVTEHYSAYSVWDLKARWDVPVWDGLTLNAGIENIFDQSYIEHLSDIRAPERNLFVGLSQTLNW